MSRPAHAKIGASEVNDLVVKHLPLARRIASRWFSRASCHADREDLIQAASFGLLSAALRYDPAMGSFAGWAYARIYGAVQDHFRGLDPMSRDMRTRRNAVLRTVSDLRSTLGRDATEEEIAAALGCSTEDLDRLRLDIRQPSFVPIDEPINERGRTLAEVLSAPAADDEPEESDPSAMGRMLSELSDREAWVMIERFAKDRKMHQIASDLHITEGRVSQIVKAALATVRRTIESVASSDGPTK